MDGKIIHVDQHANPTHGRIRGDGDGREYFFHRDSLLNAVFSSELLGKRASFNAGPGGDCSAVRVDD